MEVGIKGDMSFIVTKEMLASQDGDDTLEVFSTPNMVLKIERTAALSVLPFLEKGYTNESVCPYRTDRYQQKWKIFNF